MNTSRSFNYKNLIAVLVSVAIVGVSMYIVINSNPNPSNFITEAGNKTISFLRITAKIITGFVLLFYPAFVTYHLSAIVDWVDKILGKSHDLSKWAWVTLAISFCLGLILLNQLILGALTYIPWFAEIISNIGGLAPSNSQDSLANLRENLFSQWGWIVIASIMAVLGKGINWIKENA